MSTIDKTHSHIERIKGKKVIIVKIKKVNFWSNY